MVPGEYYILHQARFLSKEIHISDLHFTIYQLVHRASFNSSTGSYTLYFKIHNFTICVNVEYIEEKRCVFSVFHCDRFSKTLVINCIVRYRLGGVKLGIT